MKKVLVIIVTILSIIFSVENVYAEDMLSCKKSLRRWSKGSEVRILQKELNAVQNCGLAIDGSFGPATKNCVLQFQKKNSLVRDAIVGPKTCKKLNEVYSLTLKNEEESQIGSIITPTAILKRGTKNDQVKILQKLLNNSTKCNLELDGSFGYKTEWCVKKFQEENGLNVLKSGGNVDTNTIVRLNNYSASSSNALIIIEVDELNVREKASIKSKILTQVYKNETYKVYETKKDGNGFTWYKIQYKTGKWGYVRSDCIIKDFIKLDISDQTLKLYKDGKLILNVPVVTGNHSEKNDTPLGEYTIGTELSVENFGGRIPLREYDVKVDYFVSFLGGVITSDRNFGFHDADWRKMQEITNKETYLKNGSHGCVNMLIEDVKVIYDNVETGLKVYIVE